jgi:xanthine dehydrogenase iron-sulfur cluster and FAD-binding subunit A
LFGASSSSRNDITHQTLNMPMYVLGGFSKASTENDFLHSAVWMLAKKECAQGGCGACWEPTGRNLKNL